MFGTRKKTRNQEIKRWKSSWRLATSLTLSYTESYSIIRVPFTDSGS